MSEGVFTFRVKQTDNGSLVASLHREIDVNHSSPLMTSGGYYNHHYRHRYRHFERIQKNRGGNERRDEEKERKEKKRKERGE